MREARPDPKPAPRIVNDAAGRLKLRHEGRCRLCGRRPGETIYQRSKRTGRLEIAGRVPPLSRHHLVRRRQGGDDVDVNLVPLCGDGVRGCHGAVEAYQPGARERLREHLTAEEEAYVVERRGRGYLDRHYPPRTA